MPIFALLSVVTLCIGKAPSPPSTSHKFGGAPSNPRFSPSFPLLPSDKNNGDLPEMKKCYPRFPPIPYLQSLQQLVSLHQVTAQQTR